MSEKIVQLNEEIIKGQIKELVRGSVEETLNELLEKEAESLTQAARYGQTNAQVPILQAMPTLLLCIPQLCQHIRRSFPWKMPRYCQLSDARNTRP